MHDNMLHFKKGSEKNSNNSPTKNITSLILACFPFTSLLFLLRSPLEGAACWRGPPPSPPRSRPSSPCPPAEIRKLKCSFYLSRSRMFKQQKIIIVMPVNETKY